MAPSSTAGPAPDFGERRGEQPDGSPCGPRPDLALGQEVRNRIASGEGRRLELKRGLPTHGKVARTLGAFANGVGGLFVVGAEDDLTLVGVPDPGATLAELATVLRDDLRPTPRARTWIELVPNGSGRDVALVLAWVPRSEHLPHRARQSDGQWEICERLAASTRRCEPSALEAERARTAPLDADEQRVLAWIERCTRAARPARTTTARVARATGLARSRLRRALHRLEAGGWIFGWGAGDVRRRSC
ncbi:hypothetical protein Pla163_32070 [Planctomycetes bacterium Pla163]|uniref:Schlafen AlbA-2 domain-containing protein n=1 Tax=Rohdeia mirabilis TaxID=2528008 RepID=A0A518D3L7_9BACT|nr:hypothetical protein Pla163_32070 [Planctomycetes bacterium Pla163]